MTGIESAKNDITPTDLRPQHQHTEGREAMWSAREPFVQVAWDATSLSSYMQCPRRYYYEIVEGWRPKALNADILFGKTIHDSIEVYERERLAGATHDAALVKAVRHALKLSTGGIRDDVSGELLPNLDEAGEPTKTRHTAVRVVVWWAEEFGREDNLQPVALANGRPGLEVSFRLPLDITTPDGEKYLLVGHFDKIAHYDQWKVIVERKSTKTTLGLKYWDRYSPNVQVSTYAAASKIVLPEPAHLVIIEAFQTGVTFMRAERHVAMRTPAYLDEWMSEIEYWIKRAEEDGKRRRWPKNEAACTLNGGCPFRRICAKDPGVREGYLKGEFQRLTWNPLQNR